MNAPGILPSLFVLGVVALAALRLTVRRRPTAGNAALRDAAARVLAVAVGIQGVHFAEEAATGFNVLFPALFDLPAMPYSYFILFNLAWIGIWVAAIPGLRAARPAAFFAAWFLAIAGTINGIAHPLLAVVAGGYFPGLLTSPFIGGASVWLWRTLAGATDSVR